MGDSTPISDGANQKDTIAGDWVYPVITSILCSPILPTPMHIEIEQIGREKRRRGGVGRPREHKVGRTQWCGPVKRRPRRQCGPVRTQAIVVGQGGVARMVGIGGSIVDANMSRQMPR
jgi:hypothetical protein